MGEAASWRVTGLNTFLKKAAAYPSALGDAGTSATVEAAQTGAEYMRDFAMASGTGWEGRNPGDPRSRNPERPRSMIASITYDKSAKQGKNRGSGRESRSARFGWLDTYHEYFGMQNAGFTNVRKRPENKGRTWITGSGGWTEGMRAYEQALDESREVFRDAIARHTRKAWRR